MYICVYVCNSPREGMGIFTSWSVSNLFTPSAGICSPAGEHTEQQYLLHALHI